jgi:hypothetical protein
LLIKIGIVILGGYSSPSSLIELTEADLALEEEFEQYKGEFERDELLDL